MSVDINNGGKAIASLAVLSELHNNNKTILCIISEFIHDFIVQKSKYIFSIYEITDGINQDYGFNIPSTIISQALNKLDYVKFNEQQYVVDKSLLNEETKPTVIPNTRKSLEDAYKYIIDKLMDHIRLQEKSINLDQAKVEKSLYSFFLDELGYEYTEAVSSFIIKYQNDSTIREYLRKIEEGAILYFGITYNINENQSKNWNEPLYIYFDTEILFYLAGYNGSIYQNMVIELINLIQEVNKKSKKKIKLRFFQEVQDEIDSFFHAAEDIVNGDRTLMPNKTAMRELVDGVKTPFDILQKKSEFDVLLAKYQFNLDDKEYIQESNYDFNILDRDLVSKIKMELKIDELESKVPLKFLNNITIIRRDKPIRSVETSVGLLLTGDLKTLRIATLLSRRNKGNIRFAYSMEYLTRFFWYRQNKVLGLDSYPETFAIIARAQVVLSSQIDTKITDVYNKFKEKQEKGEIPKHEAIAILANLSDRLKKPEEITSDNVDDVIPVQDLDQYKYEKSAFQNKYTKEEESHRSTKINLLRKSETIYNQRTKDKNKLDKKIKRRFKILAVILIITYISFLWLGINYFFIKRDITLLTRVILAIPAVVYTGILILKPIKWFNQIIKKKDSKGLKEKASDFFKRQENKYKKEIYKKNNFDPADLVQLENEIEKLKEEVGNESQNQI